MTDPDALLKSLDTNGDGTIEASEVKADKREFFERLLRSGDADRDGKLSSKELASALDTKDDTLGPVIKKIEPPRLNPQYAIRRFDKNKDGKLEANEVPPAVRGRFEELLKSADKNGDGTLDGREIIASADLIAQLVKPGNAKSTARAKAATGLDDELFQLLDADGDGKLSDSERLAAEEVLDAIPTATPSKDNAKQLLARIWQLDANRNGKIERDEAKGPIERRFKAIDANKDKQLDKQEVKTAVKLFLENVAKNKNDN